MCSSFHSAPAALLRTFSLDVVLFRFLNANIKQEIWANAHETRDSISLILYAGCPGLSPVVSAKIHSKCASQLEIAKNSLKPIFGGSRSFKVIDVAHKKLETLGYHMVKTRSLCLTWAWVGTGSWQTDGQTDRQTDIITIANTRLAVPAVARKHGTCHSFRGVHAQWQRRRGREGSGNCAPPQPKF